MINWVDNGVLAWYNKDSQRKYILKGNGDKYDERRIKKNDRRI